MVVGVTRSLAAIGRTALAGVAGDAASLLDEMSGTAPDFAREIPSVVDVIFGPIAGAAVGVLCAACNLIDGTANLSGRVTRNAAEGGLGPTLEVP